MVWCTLHYLMISLWELSFHIFCSAEPSSHPAKRFMSHVGHLAKATGCRSGLIPTCLQHQGQLDVVCRYNTCARMLVYFDHRFIIYIYDCDRMYSSELFVVGFIHCNYFCTSGTHAPLIRETCINMYIGRLPTHKEVFLVIHNISFWRSRSKVANKSSTFTIITECTHILQSA